LFKQKLHQIFFFYFRFFFREKLRFPAIINIDSSFFGSVEIPVVIHVFSLSLSQLMVLRKFLSPDQFSRSKVEGATLFFLFHPNI
jgi:hypothetical protein